MIGANLDRMQVVKGWMDKKGALPEKIYDVAVSGDRQIGKGAAVKRRSAIPLMSSLRQSA